jgi:hypothetical protein
MGQLTDVAIRARIKAGERFEGRTDSDGLPLSGRPDRTAPHWRPRGRFAGKSRVMNLGSDGDLPPRSSPPVGQGTARQDRPRP